MRKAHSHGWDSRILVLIDTPAPDVEHFNIRAGRDEIRDLLRGLLREAALSGFDADSANGVDDGAKDYLTIDGPSADLVPPSLLQSGPTLYPDRTVHGRVTMAFVIDTTGRPDMKTARALQSDDLRMIEWAKMLIAGCRFSPARSRGQAVRVMVPQSVNYAP
jgi:hypothetical protein